jgi:hypothetical protein
MLHSLPDCPVNNYDKEWLEKTFVWFETKLGKSFVKSKEYFIPAAYTFKYNNFSSHEAIRYFINFICVFIEFDPALIDFTILWNELPGDDEGLPDDFDVTADLNFEEESVLPVVNNEGKYVVEITEEMLSDFDGTFVSLVNQITYICLFHKKIFTFYNLHMVNYAAVLLGFGLPNANAFVRTWQWSDSRHSSWQIARNGILNHRMYGYLFALLVKYRNNTSEPWLTFLTPDVANFYTGASAFLQANNTLMQMPAHAKDEEVFIEKYFDEGGRVSTLAHVVNNKMEGHATFFYENGLLWSELIYKNDVPYTVLSNYNPFNEAVEKGSLFEGNGTLFIYRADGNLEEIETYKNGEKVKSEFFD